MWWSFKSVNHSLNRFVEGKPLVHSGTKPHSELSILLCLRLKLFSLAELKKRQSNWQYYVAKKSESYSLFNSYLWTVVNCCVKAIKQYHTHIHAVDMNISSI